MHTHELDRILKNYETEAASLPKISDDLTEEQARESVGKYLGNDFVEVGEMLAASEEYTKFAKKSAEKVLFGGPGMVFPALHIAFVMGLRYAKATSQMTPEPVAA